MLNFITICESESNSDTYTYFDQQPKSYFAEQNINTAFIIRSHIGYSYQLVSLIYSLNSQVNYSGKILCAIVPTEHSDVAPLTGFLKRAIPEDILDKVFFTVLKFSKATYQKYSDILPVLCTKERKEMLIRKIGIKPSDMELVCSINCPLHYHITDLSIRYVLHSCPSCQYMVVTNGDNSYSPSFLSLTTAMLSENHAVVTDMVHQDRYYSVRLMLAEMDLGGLVIRTDVMKSANLSFINAMPPDAEAHIYHAADFHFVNRLKALGLNVVILHKVLFTHN